MKLIFVVLSFTGLLLTICPSVLVFTKMIAWETHSVLMILGSFIWFFTAPFWMKKEEQE